MSYNEFWNEIYDTSIELNSLLISYWKEYSNFDSWQFWFVLALLIIPLIILYMVVDRSRIFEVLFFGFSVHILWTYVDVMLGSTTLFVHQYFLIPILPFALSISSSVLPVGFMLIYQYCINHEKNFYLYTIIASAIFAFGFASLENFLGLIEFNNGMNMFYVFLIDLGVVFPSYWLTKFVKKIGTGD
ncbi:hypothetical protein SAMN05216389_101237 [Oceanobacillus limi]|uniref:Uncharacterized protein n=1 Tax=Oceanobacillus limi TaxID=930131 RepID=A0A1H9Y7G4_9BACI|nr:hypothetical protein [Oceanobacillus limi]SES64748.1 hypothetical protein SAMN05216389_101237 [Oceanobacillus limi]